MCFGKHKKKGICIVYTCIPWPMYYYTTLRTSHKQLLTLTNPRFSELVALAIL